MPFRLLVLALLSTFLPGCGLLFGGVKVETAKTVAKPPANILVYLSVEDDEEPVAHLMPGDFSVYENDVLLQKNDIHLELLPRDTFADGHTVLLLDLSGEITSKDLTRISRGAAQFVEKVSVTQAVTVLVFDGSKDVRLVARFPQVEAPEKREIPDLSPFVSGDGSRNLNGAVVEALKVLTRELSRSEKPVKLGTVATLVRGPDLAGRLTDDDLYDAIDETTHEFYTLTPVDVEIPTLSSLGQDSRFEYESMDTMPLRFQDLGMRVRDAWGRHYVVTYCTPARHGHRDVRIEVNFHDQQGDERRGKGSTEFDASGFDSGCGPMRGIIRERAEAEAREQAAQAQAEAEAAAERQKAEERAATRKRAAAAQKKAAAQNQAAESALGGEPPKPDESDEEVVAPPSGGKYE